MATTRIGLAHRTLMASQARQPSDGIALVASLAPLSQTWKLDPIDEAGSTGASAVRQTPSRS
jgi:hypothetical protein